MRKGTWLPVVALRYPIRIRCTKFNLVFFWMVELFNSIYRLSTEITHWTELMVICKLTYVAWVGSERSSSIFFGVMVKETLLRVMVYLCLALLCFEPSKINMNYFIHLLRSPLSFWRSWLNIMGAHLFCWRVEWCRLCGMESLNWWRIYFVTYRVYLSRILFGI